jgi:ADP-dependent NAD(P)H-hydrate dehydratase / NAD(P)H-hydrate epimerase
MKIFTAEQIRNCDEYTIKNEPISSGQLMERAAQACVDWIFENCKNHRNFAVFCGKGNNGGDGFAIARMLHLKGFDVDVFTSTKAKFSVDAGNNFRELKEFSGVSVKEFKEVKEYRFDNRTVIIDALFGTGLSKNIEGEFKELIDFLNLKISIDIPSGLFADTVSSENAAIFKADFTLSFQFWKKAFLHPETGKYAGKVKVLDIELHQEYITETKTEDFVINEDKIKDLFRPRDEFSHKGTYGKVIIAGGSYGKIGAAVLSTKSALKSGTGILLHWLRNAVMKFCRLRIRKPCLSKAEMIS